jgi:hypothetical protein
MGLGLVLAGVAAAQAAPRAALFVQNRAGAHWKASSTPSTIWGTRLADAGFEVIRYQDVLDRFAESRARKRRRSCARGWRRCRRRSRKARWTDRRRRPRRCGSRS